MSIVKSDFPTTTNAYNRTFSSPECSFVFKLSLLAEPITSTPPLTSTPGGFFHGEWLGLKNWIWMVIGGGVLIIGITTTIVLVVIKHKKKKT